MTAPMRVPIPDQRVGELPTPVLMPSPPAGIRDGRPGVSGITRQALADWFTAAGEAGWRARQVSDAIWSGRHASFEDIPQLPAALRTRLATSFRANTLVDTTVRVSDGGLTQKALHRLDDGRTIESVLMRYPARGGRRERATLCISSQAGCAVGCPFCATGELGFWRDLDTAEIVDQALFWRRHMAADGQRITNIVFMGMGEPLLNTDAVLAAADALSDTERFGLGARHITISTSGVVPGIDRLIDLRAAVHARGLAPRRATGVAGAAGAAGAALAGDTGGRGGHRVRGGHRPADHVRDGHDRGHQRHHRRRPCRRGPAQGSPGAREPHPHEPGRAYAVAAQPARSHRGVRERAAARGPAHDRAPQPGCRHRRGMWPAGRRAGRCADARGRGPPSAAAGRPVDGGAPGRRDRPTPCPSLARVR